MASVTAIIRRSLRVLGVLDPNESLRGEDYDGAKDALNAMLARWEANGLALGWAAVSDPEATLPAPDEAHDAIVYNLARRLEPEYPGKLLTPEAAQTARDTLAELRRDRLVSAPLTVASDLPCPAHWNIYTDEPI